MTIAEKDREILIKYRIEQAHEAIEATKILIDNNKLKSAVNRILQIERWCLKNRNG